MNQENRELKVLTNISEDIPNPYENRASTDIFCTAFGMFTALTLFLIAIFSFNFTHFYKANFPSDSEGRLCGIDHSTLNYPYVYFVNPPDISRRVCVKQCPSYIEDRLNCVPTQSISCSFTKREDFEVIYYQNQQIQTRSGYFCYPTDESLKRELLGKSKLASRDTFYNSIDTILKCFFLSILFSSIYFVAVQFYPKKIIAITVFLGCIVILACIICIILYQSDQHASKIVSSSILGVTLIIIMVTVFRFKQSWEIHSLFLSFSTKLVREKPSILVLIPIFFILICILTLVIVLQLTAFWTSGSLVFDNKNQIFYQLQGKFPLFLSIILALQTLWGFSFIKTAYNFCISFITSHWYMQKQVTIMSSFKNMLFKHFGSIVAGSFLTSAIFLAIDFIFDALLYIQVCRPERKKSNNCCQSIYNTFLSFLELIRQDAIAYVSLIGSPFCNSSRYCAYLCRQSVITDSPQSISRSYLISGHFLIGGIIGTFALYINGKISINAIYVVIFLSLAVGTLFISLHSNISETIQILFMLQEEFEARIEQIKKIGSYDEYVEQGEKKITLERIEERLKKLKLKPEIKQEVIKLRLSQINKLGQEIK